MSVYYGAGEALRWKRVSPDQCETTDHRFAVVRKHDRRETYWIAYVGTHPLGEHATERQAMEHCRREA